MASRNIKAGIWVDIQNKGQHDGLLTGRANYGTYYGPGKYYKLEYSQRCPRGCCYDDVVELIDKDSAINELQEVCDELKNKMNPE